MYSYRAILLKKKRTGGGGGVGETRPIPINTIGTCIVKKVLIQRICRNSVKVLIICLFLDITFQILNFFVWLRITDEGSLPEMRIWSILLIKSGLKWCIHLGRSLFSYFSSKLQTAWPNGLRCWDSIQAGWKIAGSYPAGGIYFHFDFFAPFPFLTARLSANK